MTEYVTVKLTRMEADALFDGIMFHDAMTYDEQLEHLGGARKLAAMYRGQRKIAAALLRRKVENSQQNSSAAVGEVVS